MSRISFFNEQRWSQFDVWFISDVINKIPKVSAVYPVLRYDNDGTTGCYDTDFSYTAQITLHRPGFANIRMEYPEFTIYHDVSLSLIHSAVNVDSAKESITSHITQNLMAHLDAIKSSGRIESWRFSYNYTGVIDRDFDRSLRAGEIWGYPTLQTEKKFIVNKKAERLLLSCLSKKQKNEYNEHLYFTVKGNVTGKSYRIHPDKQINIEEIDSAGRVMGRLCVVSAEYIPIEDHMLSQKLLIETNEELFLQTAIRWRS